LKAPPILLAIDPGNNCGVAVFTMGVLAQCSLEHTPRSIVRADVVVAEVPQFAHSKRGDPQNIIKLAVTLGRYLALNAAKERELLVLPQQWKGNMGKQLTLECVRKVLTPAEAEVLGPNPIHDVSDAVGLGFWYLGRHNWR
jgi:hypothetical protein